MWKMATAYHSHLICSVLHDTHISLCFFVLFSQALYFVRSAYISKLIFSSSRCPHKLLLMRKLNWLGYNFFFLPFCMYISISIDPPFPILYVLFLQFIPYFFKKKIKLKWKLNQNVILQFAYIFLINHRIRIHLTVFNPFRIFIYSNEMLYIRPYFMKWKWKPVGIVRLSSLRDKWMMKSMAFR